MSDSVKQENSDLNEDNENNDSNIKSDTKTENIESIEQKAREELALNAKKRLKEELKRKKLRKEFETEAKRLTKIIVPISLCMLFVVVSVNFFPAYSEGLEELATQIIPMYETKDSSVGTKLSSAIITVVGFVVLLALVTFCMAFVIIYEFDRFMKVFFVFSFICYLGVFGVIYLFIAVKEYNIALDWPTTIFFLWNYTGVGMATFFYAGPKVLKQAFMIIISSNLALILIIAIPNWTAWLLLLMMAVWDIYAVLHETGPLHLIFNSIDNNRRPLPPIIYTTAIWLQTNPNIVDDIDIDIGLGDFIFYSLLVGKSFVSGDFLIAIICYICILVGIAITLFLLLTKNYPLPALPISIALGLMANFITTYFVIPFNDELTEKLIFI